MGVKVKEKHPGSGVWWIYINHNGRRKSKKVGTDKKAAIRAAEKIQAKLTLGDVGLLDTEEAAEHMPTLKEYVRGWTDADGTHLGWFDKVAKLSLKNSTRTGYEQVLEAHLLPTFGDLPLNEITSRNIGDFIHSRFKKGLRSTTIKNVKNCLSAILRHANATDGYIGGNPARGVTVPRPEGETKSRDPEPLTWRERDHLEQVFQEYYPRHYPFVLCGFRTGLRIGELILSFRSFQLGVWNFVEAVMASISRDFLVPMCYAMLVTTYWARRQRATENREGGRDPASLALAGSDGRAGEDRLPLETAWKLGGTQLWAVGPAVSHLCPEFAQP